MLNTILFDLDGTLLPMEMEEFLAAYFKEISVKLAPYIKPEEVAKKIIKSTECMINNEGGIRSNKEAFIEDFKNRIDHDIDIIMPVFDDFYNNEFKNISRAVKPNPIVKDVIRNFKNKGYSLVIATNSIFPKEAIYHRIQWAGLNKDDFELITCYEKMHYCKPNPEYYREILATINKRPENAMMVGNDVEEDMVASSKLGMQTFLIEDCIISRGTDTSFCTYKGSMETLYQFSKTLNSLNSII